MRNLNIFLVVIFAICCYQTTFGQSCGGGNSFFYVYDEYGIHQIKDFSISFHIVSEDQGWRLKDFSKFGWKRQIFDEKSLEKYKNPKEWRGRLETAYEIPPSEYSRLMKEREEILKKNPNSFVTTKINRCDYYRQSAPINPDEPFSICVSEGCSLIVVAEVKAEGYETAYYVSDFTCGCTKNYEFRLPEKRKKCLPK